MVVQADLLNIFGGMIAIFAVFSALMLWMMARMESRLHSDIGGLSNRMDAMGARIDAMGARIDTTQAIIMRMLEKQGR